MAISADYQVIIDLSVASHFVKVIPVVQPLSIKQSTFMVAYPPVSLEVIHIQPFGFGVLRFVQITIFVNVLLISINIGILKNQ